MIGGWLVGWLDGWMVFDHVLWKPISGQDTINLSSFLLNHAFLQQITTLRRPKSLLYANAPMNQQLQ